MSAEETEETRKIVCGRSVPLQQAMQQSECMKRSEPPTVTFEIVRLTGPDADALAEQQARVINEVLRWLAEHPQSEDPSGNGTSRGE